MVRGGGGVRGGGVRGRRDGHSSGRYASYWNTFLFFDLFCWLFDLFRFHLSLSFGVNEPSTFSSCVVHLFATICTVHGPGWMEEGWVGEIDPCL